MDILVEKIGIFGRKTTPLKQELLIEQKKLPEMESAKQLRKLINKIYKKGMTILDVGCAAGHYYHSIIKVDKLIKFVGIDATKEYIDYANQIFKKI